MSKSVRLFFFPLFFLATSSAPLTDWIEATANHYGGPQDGEIDPFNPTVLLGGCNYGDLDPTEYPFYNVASFAPESSLMSDLDQFGCGSCFEIRCVDQPGSCLNTSASSGSHSITVVSAGTCGLGCGDKQVNLHVFAFDKLAPIRLGNIQIHLRQVECEPLGNLIILVKDYRIEKGGYIKLVVRNVPITGGLSAVWLRSSGEERWLELQNLFGASWEGSNLSSPPFDLRLRESFGNEVILEGVINEPGFEGEIDSGKQFPGFSALPDSERSNFVSNPAMPAPSPPASSQPPTPFRVGASPADSVDSTRPEVNPEDLDLTVSFSDGD